MDIAFWNILLATLPDLASHLGFSWISEKEKGIQLHASFHVQLELFEEIGSKLQF